MRKSIFAFIIFCLPPLSAVSADSPISKGSMMLGGSAYFMIQTGEAYDLDKYDFYDANTGTFSDFENPNIYTVHFSPSFSYFIKNEIMIGLSGRIGHSSYADRKANTYLGGPTFGFFSLINKSHSQIKGRHYFFMVISGLIGKIEYLGNDDFYINNGLPYSSNNPSGIITGGETYPSFTFDHSIQQLVFNIGNAYMITGNFALDMSLSVSYDRIKRKVWENGTTIQAGFGLKTFIY